MFRLYSIVMLIQGFCLYHAYTNKTDQKWYWIIVLFPLIGSMIYLYHHFYSRKNVENVSEGIKATLISNYTLDKLEEKTRFSDTYANKLELSQEHLKVGNYERAREILESCTQGNYKDDPTLQLYLLQAHYQSENYNEAVKFGHRLSGLKEFKNSDAMVAYAWSLFKTEDYDQAEEIFRQMDRKFSNYPQRLEYASFIREARGNTEAKQKLDEIIVEINSMDSYERRLNKQTINGVRKLNREIS